jgi:membrane protease YdiL (CAAX protease family)
VVPVPEPTLVGVTPEPLDPEVRRSLVRETWFVMLMFLWPVVAGALIGLVQGVTNVAGLSHFGHYIHNQAGNLVLGIVAYLPLAAAVPLALYLLSRTGQGPKVLGLGWPSLSKDVWPGIGLSAAGFGVTFGAAIILSPLINATRHAVVATPVGGIPEYYVIYGLVISLTTAIAEETFVNGYIITRLAQLGWGKEKAMWLAVALRTSYHVYYGLGFIFTIPLGIFVTRSFQKQRRLNRAIAAHFLYDAVLFTISIVFLQHVHVR